MVLKSLPSFETLQHMIKRIKTFVEQYVSKILVSLEHVKFSTIISKFLCMIYCKVRKNKLIVPKAVILQLFKKNYQILCHHCQPSLRQCCFLTKPLKTHTQTHTCTARTHRAHHSICSFCPFLRAFPMTSRDRTRYTTADRWCLSDLRNKIHVHTRTHTQTRSQAGLYYKLRCRPKALFTIVSARSCCVLQSNDDGDDDDDDDDVSGLVCVLAGAWSVSDRASWKSIGTGELPPRPSWYRLVQILIKVLHLSTIFQAS